MPEQQIKKLSIILSLIALISMSSFASGTAQAAGTYSLQVIDGVGGTWSFTSPYMGVGTYSVPVGTGVRIRAIPDTGYQWSGWKYWINGVSTPLTSEPNPTVFLSNTPNYVFKIQPVFTSTTSTSSYTITSTTVGQGSVAKNPSQTNYASGSSVQLSATPTSGWVFSSWSGDASSTSNPLTVSVTKNLAVTATFTQTASTVTYVISASVGNGGTVSPAGSTTVAKGMSQTYTFTSNSGYQISNVLVDGSSVGALSSYTFSNVQAPHTISASFTQRTSTATYTIYKSGTTIIATNAAGTTITSSTNFGAVFNYLNSRLLANDVVYITGNTIYPVYTRPTLTKSYITVEGGSGAVLSNQGSDPVFMIRGTYNTVKKIDFIDNYPGGWSGAVVIQGSYNTVTECTLDNCDRYGFLVEDADHFTLTYNKVYKAQYGISGATSAYTSTNGYVAYNVIGDCNQAGIKIKWWKDVVVEYNYIDVGYKEFAHTGYNNGQFGTTAQNGGMIGIRYYHADLPSINVICKYNTIVDTTKESYRGIGFLVDADTHGDWQYAYPGYTFPNPSPIYASGEKIYSNTIQAYQGIIIRHSGVDLRYNDCTQTRSTGIVLETSGCILVGNTGTIKS